METLFTPSKCCSSSASFYDLLLLLLTSFFSLLSLLLLRSLESSLSRDMDLYEGLLLLFLAGDLSQNNI